MSLTPFGLQTLGLDASAQQQSETNNAPLTQPPEPTADTARQQQRASPRRAMSNFNAFQTSCTPCNDSPPSYQASRKHKSTDTEIRRSVRSDVLPKYTCSVFADARMLLQVESINPLHRATADDWREVHVVVRGTMLSVHKRTEQGPGKLLKRYTLQHAEIGLAPDVSYTVLIPTGRLGRLIPLSARQRAWRKDPDLFKPEVQHILRLRIETDQILLADSSEDRIAEFTHAISAGIDIAPALDERAIPRHCTAPRRRRRRPEATGPATLTDSAVIAEQERIFREMYPDFAGATVLPPAETTQSENASPNPSSSNLELSQTLTSNTQSPAAREDEDLDLAAMREDASESPASAPPTSTNTRPTATRTTTTDSVLTMYSIDMMHATDPANFAAETGKWAPPHPRSPAQIERYIRRCMPILTAHAPRASDVLVCAGRRVRVNWRMELLEEWELKPPSYRAHGFEEALSATATTASSGSSTTTTTSSAAASQLGRSGSQRSTATASNNAASASMDDITPLPTPSSEDRIEFVSDLVKVVSKSSTASPARASIKGLSPAALQSRNNPYEPPNIVFCF